MRAAHLSVTPQGKHVQLVFYKSEWRARARSTFLVLLHPARSALKPPLLFLRADLRQFVAARVSAWVPEFRAGWSSMGPASPPGGFACRWTSLSLPCRCECTGRPSPCEEGTPPLQTLSECPARWSPRTWSIRRRR